ncbi:hypothetical protein [Herbaspirillum huttiense]|uniref:hypothetical protein n=1 Tax=Herbaspirillum huttiense TaxID=863372 RepID=UPI002176B32B|nr:hypothetical protein [Herbaspirillum huttiense]UWE15657.1 hypothetical protein NY669_21630 [Herbaspirillum huttiense]
MNNATRSAVTSALTQGIGVVTGLQRNFNWMGVVASAASSAIATGLDEGLGLRANDVNRTSPTELLKSAFSGVVTRVSSARISGGKVDFGQIAVDVFGNALGNGFAERAAVSGQPQETLSFSQDVANRRASNYWNPSNTVDNWDSSVMGGGDNPNSPTSSITLNAENTDNQSLINANNLATMPNYYGNSVAGQSYVAARGESISKILGTSDPQAVGNFMRANGLTNSNLVAGNNYFIPDSTDAYGDSSALGQKTLNTDNARIALIAQQQALAAQNQLASSAGNPYDSINLRVQVTRDNPYGLTDDQRASVMAYAKGGWVQNPGLAVSFTPNMQSAAADMMRNFSQGPQVQAVQGNFGESTDLLYARVDAARNGPFGAAAVLLTQNSDPVTQLNAARTAEAADGLLTAFGATAAAKAELGAFRYTSTNVTSTTGANSTVEAAAIHPGQLAAESADVSQASLLRALRQAGTPESLATSKLISRGNLDVNILATDPSGRGLGGLYRFGTNEIDIYGNAFSTSTEAAGYATHEATHFMQGLNRSNYNLGHEFDAFRAQGAVDLGHWSNGLGDQGLYDFLSTHPVYRGVRPDPTWPR